MVSAAIEGSIPDVKAAKEERIEILTRAQLLAEIFHDSKASIGIAGTSGKTTVTGMVATVLSELDCKPTVMNGGQVKNLENTQLGKGVNFLIGKGDVFVSEMDESDKSIELFSPTISVLNNISIDHMTMDELKKLFGDFVFRADRAVLNLDEENTASLKRPENAITFSLENSEATLYVTNIQLSEGGCSFDMNGIAVKLNVPGRHNISNALATLGVVMALNLDIEAACQALAKFSGIKRRMETVGVKNGVTVIDDFGHNPDKIAAGLATAKQNGARIIAMFQPHGFTPLRLMGDEILQSFKTHFTKNDILIMPEVYYAGGTVDRSVTARDIIGKAKAISLNAHWFEKRAEIIPFITEQAKSGDKIMIMGARDDTLSDFAKEILDNL